MIKREFAASIFLFLILFALPVGVVVYQGGLLPALSAPRVIDINAAIAENGGFQPSSIAVNAGETVMLRFRSDDVAHGIAIGPGLGIDLGRVEPGHTREVTVVFDHAGTYTFYCNTWCSPNHWRMRGVLTVSDPQQPDAISTAQPDSVIQTLIAQNVNIDATSEPASDLIAQQPAAARGRDLVAQLTVPAELEDSVWRRTHTAAQGVALLLASNPAAAQADLVDAVAYLWTQNADPARLTAAAVLYAKNCVSCHGATGGGDGFMTALLAAKPAAFSDAAYLFTRRMDVLYAKIRRGGMGTDMPNFGTLFTPDETWALVDYLWTLAVSPQNPHS